MGTADTFLSTLFCTYHIENCGNENQTDDTADYKISHSLFRRLSFALQNEEKKDSRHGKNSGKSNDRRADAKACG